MKSGWHVHFDAVQATNPARAYEQARATRIKQYRERLAATLLGLNRAGKRMDEAVAELLPSIRAFGMSLEAAAAKMERQG